MTVECFVHIVGGDGYSLKLKFAEVPRVGEFIGFSRDGNRDEDGVLRSDLYSVKHVIHVPENDLSPPMVTIDVELVRRNDRPTD